MGDPPSLRQQGTRIGIVWGTAGAGCLLLSALVSTAVITTGAELLGWILLAVAASLWMVTWHWDE